MGGNHLSNQLRFKCQTNNTEFCYPDPYAIWCVLTNNNDCIHIQLLHQVCCPCTTTHSIQCNHNMLECLSLSTSTISIYLSSNSALHYLPLHHRILCESDLVAGLNIAGPIGHERRCQIRTPLAVMKSIVMEQLLSRYLFNYA